MLEIWLFWCAQFLAFPWPETPGVTPGNSGPECVFPLRSLRGDPRSFHPSFFSASISGVGRGLLKSPSVTQIQGPEFPPPPRSFRPMQSTSKSFRGRPGTYQKTLCIAFTGAGDLIPEFPVGRSFRPHPGISSISQFPTVSNGYF